MTGESEFLGRIAGESRRETTDFLRRVDNELGPEGSGVLYVPKGLSEQECDDLFRRLTDESVEWLDARETFTNERGIEVTQNFSSYGLKLHHPDTNTIELGYGMREVAAKVQTFVRSLSGVFPMLADWEVDEAVAQRYDPGVGLTWHKDLKRHHGVIVTANISGQAELHHRTDEQSEENVIEEGPGDLTIVRATNLDEIWCTDKRPEHAVRNVAGDRISLTFRANSRPNDPIPGFKYNNWETTVA